VRHLTSTHGQPPTAFLSLFAGVGGFDLPLTRLGLDCVGQVELDPGCRSVLARHFPEVPRHDDVRTTIAWWQAQGHPEVELVCAGFPCQDLSVAGRRAGLAGARSGLFFDLAGVLDAVRPRWVLLENVPGLLSSRQGTDFATVLGTLAELGYGVSWRVLDSRYFGVAQRRRRVFLVGRRGAICPFQVLFEPHSGPGDLAPRRPPPPGPARTAPRGAGAARRHPASPRPDQAGGVAEVAATLTASLGHHGYRSPRGDGTDTLIVSPAAGGQVVPALLANRGGQRTTDLNTPMVAVLPSASDREQPGRLVRSFAEDQRGEVTTAAVASVAAGGGQPGQRYPAVLLAAPDPSGTLTARTGKGPSSTVDDGALVTTHPTVTATAAEEGVIDGPAGPGAGVMVRRLTPRECERLQGFPDDWTAAGAGGRRLSDSARYRAMGNAVTVPVVAWIGARLLAAHHATSPPRTWGGGW
jgi:DNA (cytosine-5)-methyltransferase 1